MKFPEHEVAALIPARDVGATIGGLVMELCKKAGVVCVVAHRCRDGTAGLARQAGAEVVESAAAGGKGAAFAAGLAHLSGNPRWRWLLCLDGDGQHEAGDAWRVLGRARADHLDMAVGTRAPFRRPMPRARRWANRAMTASLRALTGLELTDTQCGLRAFSRRLAEGVRWRARHFDLETEMVWEAARRGARVGEVPVGVAYGAEESWIEPVADTLRWVGFLGARLAEGGLPLRRPVTCW